MALLALTILAYVFSSSASDEPVNIALGKERKFCLSPEPVITDGDKLTQKIFNNTQSCAKRPYVDVILDGYYHIHYVIVFLGAAEGSSIEQSLYFGIFLFDDYEEKGVCSTSLRTGSEINEIRGVRANCHNALNRYNRVILEWKRNVMLSLSEIEIYSFATVEGLVWIHRGCFKGGKLGNPLGVLDWRTCQDHCSKGGFPFSALKAPSENFQEFLCHCIMRDRIEQRVLPEECNVTCQDSTYSCGGAVAYSVYLVIVEMPTYVGCFEDPRETGELHIKNKKMTPGLCLHKCDEKGLERAMVKSDGTCHCIRDIHDMFPEAVSVESQCTKKCPGDSNFYCGSKGYVSTYEGCKFTACSVYFQCSKGSDEYGVCRDGCRNGYAGEYCQYMGELKQITTTIKVQPSQSGALYLVFGFSFSVAFCIIVGSVYYNKMAKHKPTPAAMGSSLGSEELRSNL